MIARILCERIYQPVPTTILPDPLYMLLCIVSGLYTSLHKDTMNVNNHKYLIANPSPPHFESEWRFKKYNIIINNLWLKVMVIFVGAPFLLV